MSQRFVVDNSVVMAWCFADEANAYADAVLDSMSAARAVVPAIWPLEVVNVLLVAERRQRLKATDSVRFISLLSQLPIEVEPIGPRRAMSELLALARTHDLSSYDAAYLELAMRLGLPLATLDGKLLEAVNRTGVPLLAL